MPGAEQGYDRDATGALVPHVDHSELLMAKNRSKQVTKDLMTLQNRLNLLRQEKGKADKKLDETRKRTEEIHSLKHRNLSKQRERSLAKQQQDAEMKRQQDFNTMCRQERKNACAAQQNAMLSHKHGSAEIVRAQRKENKEELLANKELNLMNNQKLRDTVRAHKAASGDRMKRQQGTFLGTLSKERGEHVEIETARAMQAEQMLQTLEELEQKYIMQLQQSQEEEKIAYEELQAAVMSTTPAVGSLPSPAGSPRTGGPTTMMSMEEAMGSAQ